MPCNLNTRSFLSIGQAHSSFVTHRRTNHLIRRGHTRRAPCARHPRATSASPFPEPAPATPSRRHLVINQFPRIIINDKHLKNSHPPAATGAGTVVATLALAERRLRRLRGVNPQRFQFIVRRRPRAHRISCKSSAPAAGPSVPGWRTPQEMVSPRCQSSASPRPARRSCAAWRTPDARSARH